MARRRTRAEKDRNIVVGGWSAAVLLGVLAWRLDYVGLWGLPILTLAFYQLCVVPTLCGVETTKGSPCKNRAYGRLLACKEQPSHKAYKTDALVRLLGVRRSHRSVSAPAPYSRAPQPTFGETSQESQAPSEEDPRLLCNRSSFS